MTYKAIIAEDEEELRIYLKSLLEEIWPELDICAEAANGEEALRLVKSLRPQIAFLDIKMPGLSGLDVAKEIAGICRIVFVTAFNQYAVEAFEQEAVDYLVKPVTKKRLTQTVQRLKNQLQSSQEPKANIADIITQVLANIQTNATSKFLQWIKTQEKDGIRLIPVDEVDYFKAEDKYTLVMTADAESLIRKSIKELARELDPQQYWQIHRSTIVNVSKIEKFGSSLTGRGFIKLKKRSENLIVSRKYLYIFKQL